MVKSGELAITYSVHDDGACSYVGMSVRLIVPIVYYRGWVLFTGLRQQLLAESPAQALPIDVLNGNPGCGKLTYTSESDLHSQQIL